MTDAPDDDGDRAIIAGEYVLGLLDADAAAALRARAAADPALAREIQAWENRLAPLAGLATPAEPSELTWARIRRSMAGEDALAAPPASASSGEARRVERWRAVAIASAAVAILLAGYLALRPPSPPSRPWVMATALLSAPGTAEAAMRARVMSSGAIRVEPLIPIHVEAGRRLEFWAWPRSRPGPIPLGTIAPTGGQVEFPFEAQEGTPVMVTSEPASGPGPTPGRTVLLGLLVTPG
jgi:anti-sigma-K factor RskA